MSYGLFFYTALPTIVVAKLSFFLLEAIANKVFITFSYRLKEREISTAIAVAIVGRAIQKKSFRNGIRKKQRTDKE